ADLAQRRQLQVVDRGVGRFEADVGFYVIGQLHRAIELGLLCLRGGKRLGGEVELPRQSPPVLLATAESRREVAVLRREVVVLRRERMIGGALPVIQIGRASCRERV